MGLFSSKQKSKSTNEAAGFVQPYLSQSAGRYGSLATPEAFGGNWQAGLDPMLSGAWSSMYNNPMGAQYMGQMANMAGMGNQAMMAGMGLADRGFRYDQGLYDQTMANMMPGIQSQFDVGARGIQQNTDWNVLPGLNMAASMSGQQGSTKEGQQTALAQAAADQSKASLGADLWGRANQMANQNAMTSGMQSLGAAAGLYGQFAGLGNNALNSAFNMNQSILGNQLAAGQGAQGYAQQGIDYNRMQWDQQQQLPWQFEGQRLGNLANVGNMFGTRTNTATSSPGLGNLALQGGAAWLGGGGGNPFAGMSGLFGGGGLDYITTGSTGLPFAQMYR